MDRFGEPSRAVQNLLAVASLKALAHTLYFTEVKQMGEELRFTMHERAQINPAVIPLMLKHYGDQ